MSRFLDNYEVLHELGTGATAIVEAVRDPKTGEIYAAKILKKSNYHATERKFREYMDNEISSLRTINHPNILSYIDSNANGLYIEENHSDSYNCRYLLMELCSNGELFDMILHTGSFDEGTARFYFTQILGALEACHNAGIAHRDLKPQNILFDSEFNLKIADFGFSIFYENKQPKTKLGTIGHQAPEILRGGPYSGPKVDIFATGVILFIMYSQRPPFREAAAGDLLYGFFLNNQDKFWDLHSKNRVPTYYSEEFKDLMRGMLADDPDQRPTIEQIKSLAWFNGVTIDLNSISANIRVRRQKMLDDARKTREEKKMGDTGDRGTDYKGNTSDSQGLSLSFSGLPEGFLAERVPSGTVHKGTRIITGLYPDEILKIVFQVLDEFQAEAEIMTTSKLTVNYVSPLSKVVFGLKFCLIEEEQLHMLDFTPEGGSPYEMICIFNSIKEKIAREQEA